MWRFADNGAGAQLIPKAMVYLYAVRVFGTKGHLFLPYLLTVWIGIVYTANHWVIDVIAGALYAVLAFAGTELLWRRFGRPGPAASPCPPDGEGGTLSNSGNAGARMLEVRRD